MPQNKFDLAIDKAASSGVMVCGEDYQVLPETTSTMNDADAAIRLGCGHGYTIIALSQTAGVGSKDIKTGETRKWASPSGNLHMSMVVALDRNKGEHGEMIEMVAGLTAGQVARMFVKDKSIPLAWHWPNDLWRSNESGIDEKFCGVLVRPTDNMPGGDRVVLGIGVNLATIPDTGVTRDGAKNTGVTSLRACGAEITIGQFVMAFQNVFQSNLNRMRHYGFVAALEEMGFARRGSVVLTNRETREPVVGKFIGFTSKHSSAGVAGDYIYIDEARRPESCYHLRELAGVSLIPL